MTVPEFSFDTQSRIRPADELRDFIKGYDGSTLAEIADEHWDRVGLYSGLGHWAIGRIASALAAGDRDSAGYAMAVFDDSRSAIAHHQMAGRVAETELTSRRFMVHADNQRAQIKIAELRSSSL